VYDAYELALRLLRHRDYAARELARRLAERGIAEESVTSALERLRAAGLVDDARYARARARSLAERGAGDALIRHDLERAGVSAEDAGGALASIPAEVERASAIVRRRGDGPRTARYLRAKGFDAEVVAGLVAGGRETELG
jgi:regulatory protein